MAARSVDIYFENYLNFPLSLKQDSLQLQHGIWDSYPPQKIAAIEGGVPGKAHWETESDGFATGTQGSCVYAFSDTTSGQICYINISWDDPYSGSNAYSITTDSASATVAYSGGGGDNAAVTFTVKPR